MHFTVLLMASLLTQSGGGSPAPGKDPDAVLKKLSTSKASNNPNVQRAEADIQRNSAKIRAAEGLRKKKPKTCEEKCDFIAAQATGAVEDPPEGVKVKGAQRAKQNATKKALEKNLKDLAKTCKASCTSKGTIDRDYMKEHLDKPSAPNYPSGGHPPSGGGGGGGGDSQ